MSNNNIIVTDLDGCLTKYPKYFLDWVGDQYGFFHEDLNELKSSISESDYEALKHGYRISGVKRNLPLIDHSCEVLTRFKKKGFYLWIMTSRPKWEPVFSDTIYWLKKNNFPYDKIYFLDNKKTFLENSTKNNIKVVVDDEYELIESLATKTDDIILFWLQEKKNKVSNSKIKQVSSWKEIERQLK